MLVTNIKKRKATKTSEKTRISCAIITYLAGMVMRQHSSHTAQTHLTHFTYLFIQLTPFSTWYTGIPFRCPLMRFESKEERKCKHILVTNKRNIIQTSYNIHGQTLKETTQAKYLRVTLDNKLSWNSYVDQVTKRANQTTAFLRRNLSSCSKDVKAKCYKALIVLN